MQAIGRRLPEPEPTIDLDTLMGGAESASA